MVERDPILGDLYAAVCAEMRFGLGIVGSHEEASQVFSGDPTPVSETTSLVVVSGCQLGQAPLEGCLLGQLLAPLFQGLFLIAIPRAPNIRLMVE